MARKILAVILGYLTMAAFVFISFTVLYLLLGAEEVFQEGTYHVSTTWMVLSIIFSIAAAVIGGFICTLVAKDRKVTMILAGIVFVIGIVLAIPAVNELEENMNMVRKGSVPDMEAMQNAKQPAAKLILNPTLGAVGVLGGSRLWKEKDKST